MNSDIKVLVGMSGGMDSAVTSYLLKEKGYDVTGVTMKLWKPERSFSSVIHGDACFSPNEKEDVEKARVICEKIGIRHVVLDISDEYEKNVLENFRREYLDGRTPNPCVWCNQKIKFGALLEEARKAGLVFDFFATGHYARTEKLPDGRTALKRAADLFKDQSYFLYRLSQNQLNSVMFPLGGLNKKDVKKLDFKLGFHDENQKESQDFYSGPYSDLLDTIPRKGRIIHKNGQVLGEHEGYWNYTIGQRKGLGVSWSQPLYVVSIIPDENTVVLGEYESVLCKEIICSDVNFVSASEDVMMKSSKEGVHCSAKIRSAGTMENCTAYLESKNGINVIRAVFDEGVFAGTPGQSLVLYKDDYVLCGGIIREVF